MGMTIRDLFDGPQIEQHLRELDNDRQQQITVTAEVHEHVDEVKNNRLHSLKYTFIQNWTDSSLLFFAVFTR